MVAWRAAVARLQIGARSYLIEAVRHDIPFPSSQCGAASFSPDLIRDHISTANLIRRDNCRPILILTQKQHSARYQYVISPRRPRKLSIAYSLDCVLLTRRQRSLLCYTTMPVDLKTVLWKVYRSSQHFLSAAKNANVTGLHPPGILPNRSFEPVAVETLPHYPGFEDWSHRPELP